MSRIYGGVHFAFNNVEGRRSGGLIGDYVSANFLLPINSLPHGRQPGQMCFIDSCSIRASSESADDPNRGCGI